MCKDANIALYYVFFQLQLLKYLGYQPIIENCTQCGALLQYAQYDFTLGQLTCSPCATNHKDYSVLKLTKGQLLLIKKLSNMHINLLESSISFEIAQLEKIKKYLLCYISFHIVNIKNIKSMVLIK